MVKKDYSKTKTGLNKHLVIVFWNLGVGGVQRKIVDIINYLGKTKYSDWKITLILEEKRQLDFIGLIRNKNLVVVYKNDWLFEKFKIKRNIRFSSFLLIWFYLNKVDSVLTFLTKLSIFTVIIRYLLFWKKFDLVLSEDIVTSFYLKRENFPAYASKFVSFFYPRANRVIAPSSCIRNNLVFDYGLAPSKVRFIKNWTNIDTVENELRKFDIIYAGRVDKEKKVFGTIYLCEKLSKEVSFVIAGSGEERMGLETVINNKKLNLFFLPETTNVKKYLKNSKIMVSFATSEGMPLTFLEAVACGTVIIAMHFPGIEELIIHRKNGFICKSIDEMSMYISFLLKNPKQLKLISRRAKETLSKGYSERNIDEYLEELNII